MQVPAQTLLSNDLVIYPTITHPMQLIAGLVQLEQASSLLIRVIRRAY